MLARHPPIRLSGAFVASLIPAALAILCMLAVSASDLPLVVFLAALLVLERAWRKHDAGVLLPALARAPPRALSRSRSSRRQSFPSSTAFPNARRSAAFVDENPANWNSASAAYSSSTPATDGRDCSPLLALVGAALCLMRRRPAWVGGLDRRLLPDPVLGGLDQPLGARSHLALAPLRRPHPAEHGVLRRLLRRRHARVLCRHRRSPPRGDHG